MLRFVLCGLMCWLSLATGLAETVTLDGQGPGRTFEGLGALSAGASSRLLIDYPEPQRSQVLDLLFRPNYGASLHHLKVEIGGDVNSTDGTEPSYARTREEFEHPRPEYFDRGYEWWLMREAKKRNPDIYLDVLHDIAWIKLLRKTLDNRGLTGVGIVASDQSRDIWNIIEPLNRDSELKKAVHAVGVHYPGWPHGDNEPVKVPLHDGLPVSPQAAKDCGRPLWSSEDGPWRGDWSGAGALAKMFNRNYSVGRMTKTVIWSLISSYYENLPLPNSGLMKANTPWSGYYEVQPALWAIAHTTQFTRPGWKYLDGACGLLQQGGSYASLRSPLPSGDYSTIIETIDAKATQKLSFRLSGGLSDAPVHVWRTNRQSHFERQEDIAVINNAYSLVLEPGCIYSLTTTVGQQKGSAAAAPPAEFPLPYQDDFETTLSGKTPKYFADQSGAFEVAKRPDGNGQCMRQTISRRGIEWMGNANPEPFTEIGSIQWTNYEVECEACLQNEGQAVVYGRLGIPKSSEQTRGYALMVGADGRWELKASSKTLAAGKVEFAAGRWHKIALKLHGTRIIATVNGVELTAIEDRTFNSGMAGVGSGWHNALFDNFLSKTVSSEANMIE